MQRRSSSFRSAWSHTRFSRALAAVWLIGMVGVGDSRAAADDAAAAEPVRVFTGTVVDEAGVPIPDALVEWGHFRAQQSEREFTFTNEAGEYRLETTRAWQDFRLGVHKPGYGPRWMDGLIPARDGSVVDFTLPAGRDVTGVVVDSVGVPLPGVIVQAKATEHIGITLGFEVQASQYPGPPRVATTNERGEFVLHDIAEVISTIRDGDAIVMQRVFDATYLTFLRDGKRMGRSSSFPISMPVVHAVSSLYRPVTPATAGVVRASVVDATTLQPVTDFRVRWQFGDSAETFSSPNGEFTLSEPFTRGQEYQIEVLADGYAPGASTIAAVGAEEKPPATIALTPHYSLQCEVVDALSGGPLPGVEIVSGVYFPNSAMDVIWSQLREGSRHWQLAEQQRIVTDSEGRGTLVEGVSPQYQFIIHPGYARTIVEPEMREALLTADKTLRIELQPESRISGRIRMSAPPGSAYDLSLRQVVRNGRKEIYQNFFPEGLVNSEGEFEFDRLSEGTYFLEVRLRIGDISRDFWSTEVKVDVEERVQVEVGAPAGPHTLLGQTQPFTVMRLRQLEPAGELVFAAYADAEGHFEIPGLPEGYYKVEIEYWSASQGVFWRRDDFVEVVGDTVRDFTAAELSEQ